RRVGRSATEAQYIAASGTAQAHQSSNASAATPLAAAATPDRDGVARWACAVADFRSYPASVALRPALPGRGTSRCTPPRRGNDKRAALRSPGPPAMKDLIDQLRRAALLAASNGPDDGELLERFLVHRDEAAFEALVRRHGPMVLGVCRRL